VAVPSGPRVREDVGSTGKHPEGSREVDLDREGERGGEGGERGGEGGRGREVEREGEVVREGEGERLRGRETRRRQGEGFRGGKRTLDKTSFTSAFRPHSATHRAEMASFCKATARVQVGGRPRRRRMEARMEDTDGGSG